MRVLFDPFRVVILIIVNRRLHLRLSMFCPCGSKAKFAALFALQHLAFKKVGDANLFHYFAD